MSQAIGGPIWKFITELGLAILMVGTLISGIQQIGESMAAGVTFIQPNYTGVFVRGDACARQRHNPLSLSLQNLQSMLAISDFTTVIINNQFRRS